MQVAQTGVPPSHCGQRRQHERGIHGARQGGFWQAAIQAGRRTDGQTDRRADRQKRRRFGRVVPGVEPSAEAHLRHAAMSLVLLQRSCAERDTYFGLAFTAWDTGRLHTAALALLAVLGVRGVLGVSGGGRGSGRASHCWSAGRARKNPHGAPREDLVMALSGREQQKEVAREISYGAKRGQIR